MKIAIITWINGCNYGTKLQAFALQAYLKNEGYNVDLIQYIPSNSDVIKEPLLESRFIFERIVDRFKRLITEREYASEKIKHADEYAIRLNRADAFLFNNATMTQKVVSNEDFNMIASQYDVFICGSDQIWNPRILNKRFYLDFVKNKRKIAYAPSVGLNAYSEYEKRHILSWLYDFESIGIREIEGTQLIKSILTDSNIEVQNVCDPTLLLDSQIWKKYMNQDVIPRKKYAVVYVIQNYRWYDSVLDILIKKGYEVIIIPMTSRMLRKSKSEWITYGPSEFLGLLSSADLVVTDSFHAIIFSLIFQREFFVLLNDNKGKLFNTSSRQKTILTKAGLLDRIVEKSSQLECKISNRIEYKNVYLKLVEFIDSSKDFLRRNLK